MERLSKVIALSLAVLMTIPLVGCRASDNLETVEELMETMERNVDDYSDRSVLICYKKGGEDFKSQTITVNFFNDGLASDVFIEEVYYNKDDALANYEKAIAEDANEEVLLDGTHLTYSAIKKFEYYGKTKEEVLKSLNEYKEIGKLNGYEIKWK